MRWVCGRELLGNDLHSENAGRFIYTYLQAPEDMEWRFWLVLNIYEKFY